MNDEVGKEDGFLKAKVVTEEDKQMPPVKGWTYADGKGNWPSDPNLVCSREVTPACSKIIVQLEGEAKEKHPKLGGRYLPLKGKINRGRWVGSYNNNNNTHLHLTIVILMQISPYMCV